VNFSPDGKTIAASGYKGKIRIWNLESGNLERTLTFSDLSELLMTVVYSPDSQLLASATFEGKVGVWRVSDGKLLYTFDGPDLNQSIGSGEAYYDCLAWSPNGQIIALAGSDGLIYMIKADNGELLRKLEGHTKRAAGVAFSPDGKRLASVSTDGTIRIWGISP
jgi:WD40 repeat protein